ncbi:hypothetical protein EAF04_003226 [Stromatinia cepivora]|nr:hypothetical protein EAF04_003226 [Stromatinia cepivora]
MLTMFRAGSRSDGGSDSTEEIIRDGYPYYFKKNNGRMVMARNISGSRGNKNFSLLGQAFGIDEPKRKSSVNASRRRKKKKPAQLQYLPQPQAPFSAPPPQQPFPNFPQPPMPFAPVITQQPFPSLNFFVPTNSGFPSFYPVPGFPAEPAPAPASTPAQQPTRWAFQPKVSKPPNFEELQKVESDFLKREKSKSRTRDGDNDDHTEIKKTATTTTITKHICVRCGRDRSAKYHLDNPIRAAVQVAMIVMKVVQEDMGMDEKEVEERKLQRRSIDGQPTSRPNSVELLSQDETRDDGRSNDYRDEIIVEEEAVHEHETAPKSKARRTDNNSRASVPRSYTRTRERDLDDDDPTPRREPKVRINITNQSLSASPPSTVYETREKSVHFDQPAGRSNTAPQAASQQNLRESYRYVEPLRSATSYASLPRSVRFSRESPPSLHTRDHAQRRRSERAYAERTYDHDAREQEYEHVPRRRSDENAIVVETEHEQPRSRTETRYQPRPRPPPRSLSSDEDFIAVETEHEYPRFQTEQPRHEPRRPQERRRSPARTPVRTRETYITTEVDQHGNETQYKWTTSRASSSLSSAIGFIPSIRRTSTDVHRPSTVHRSSESSEEYNRASRSEALEASWMVLNTPPRVPDPPTSNGVWEPRNGQRSARRRGRSTSQSNVPQVPQHQSTPRNNQAWMNASIIDQLGQRLEQNRPSRVRSRSSDSQSSGSMVTQSDSFRTPSPSDSVYELDSSDSTPLSVAPLPVSVHETTESGNEVESTIVTHKSKGNHCKKSFPTKQIALTPISVLKAVADDDDNTTILDDATDLTLRTARSKAAMLDRIAARRRVSFANSPQFAATPEQSRENSWAANTNSNGKESWGANINTNDGQSWGASANTDADDPWGANTNTTGNDFWSSNTATGSVLPDVGGYSGLPSGNAQ